MKTPIAMAGLLCAGIIVAPPVLAEDSGASSGMLVKILFRAGDADGNGRLDPGEIDALRQNAFKRADLDGDGVISQREIAQAATKRQRRADMARLMGEQQLDLLDLDGNGAITQDEFVSAPRPGFALLDVNGDGAIDRAELDRAAGIVAQMR